MTKDLMTTKEVAEYLGVHEKQIYALIKSKKIPCTRVTGKWLFPKNLIDQWIAADAKISFSSHAEAGNAHKAILAAGSNDPVLDILLNYMKQKLNGFHIFSCSTGSTEGLILLSRNAADVAFCHLLDPETGEYNIPFLSSFFSGGKIAVVHLFYREIGLCTSLAMAGKIKKFVDLGIPEITVINRQKGSGTRILFDHLLGKNSIDPAQLAGYHNEVYTHFEIGLGIISGEADAGLATVAAAKLFGLNFIPLARESFDMILLQETYFKKEIQAFIETLNSASFREKVRPLGNYDFTESGKVIYSLS